MLVAILWTTCYNNHYFMMPIKNDAVSVNPLTNELAVERPKIKLKQFIIRGVIAIIFLVASIFLIVRVFPDQWYNLSAVALGAMDHQSDSSLETTAATVTPVVVEIATEASASAPEASSASTTKIIDNLVQAILTASDSAKIASPSTSLDN